MLWLKPFWLKPFWLKSHLCSRLLPLRVVASPCAHPPLAMASSRAPSAASTAATKRSRTDGDGADEASITRAEFHALLATFRSDVTADITAAVTDKTSARMEQLVTKLDESFTRRLNAQELTVSDIAARTAALENDKVDIVARLDRLQAALPVADVAPRAADMDGSFNRAPDPTVIRLSAKELFSPDAAREAPQTWFQEAEIDDDAWEVIPTGGGGISKHHVVSLKGQAKLAARRVRKLLDLRRLPGGGWKANPQVRTPTGRMIVVFASPDKNMKQIRTELDAKRLYRALVDSAGGKTVHHNKARAWSPSIGAPSPKSRPSLTTTSPCSGTLPPSPPSASTSGSSSRSSTLAARPRRALGGASDSPTPPWLRAVLRPS